MVILLNPSWILIKEIVSWIFKMINRINIKSKHPASLQNTSDTHGFNTQDMLEIEQSRLK